MPDCRLVPYTCSTALLTDTGRIRPFNEDAIGQDPAAGLFILADGGRVLGAQGRSVMVCFNYHENKSIAVPERWRTALARMRED